MKEEKWEGEEGRDKGKGNKCDKWIKKNKGKQKDKNYGEWKKKINEKRKEER